MDRAPGVGVKVGEEVQPARRAPLRSAGEVIDNGSTTDDGPDPLRDRGRRG